MCPMTTLAPDNALIAELNTGNIKMGDLKKRAKAIKVDHGLAQQLWASGCFHPRMLAVLILDKKQLGQTSIEALAADMSSHPTAEGNYLSEWLLANQLMKDRRLSALIETWQDHASPILRRLFWYRQARLRWTGQEPPGNSAELMAALEKTMSREDPVVQWTMNFCAGQIGIREPEYRARCIKLGEKLGLYKEERARKGCTPNYLPEFIRIEVGKLEG
jgi:3-methyladenine DNA glycosylase AlkD